MNKKILRIIDANINRITEGLRVVEEVLRFVYDEEIIYKNLRKVRHNLVKSFSRFYPLLISVRNSVEDPGRTAKEKKYKNVNQIIISNLRRCTESFRVLEEISKLVNPKNVMMVKKLRYKLYDLEKHILEKIQ
ncbi:MAG: thiamine-phosphate pyrophosphorylase, partial [Endomicrobia bacterium]|nr:thiamine-phosphate pyrophosphorylase [Endomicrobiia bacterium]